MGDFPVLPGLPRCPTTSPAKLPVPQQSLQDRWCSWPLRRLRTGHTAPPHDLKAPGVTLTPMILQRWVPVLFLYFIVRMQNFTKLYNNIWLFCRTKTKNMWVLPPCRTKLTERQWRKGLCSRSWWQVRSPACLFIHPIYPSYNNWAWFSEENLPPSKKSINVSVKILKFTTLARFILPVFLFIGESGLGKSTLVNSLFLTDLYKDRKVPSAQGEKFNFNNGGDQIFTSFKHVVCSFFSPFFWS